MASSLNHVSGDICPIRDIIPIIRGVLPGKALSDVKQRQRSAERNQRRRYPKGFRREATKPPTTFNPCAIL